MKQINQSHKAVYERLGYTGLARLCELDGQKQQELKCLLSGIPYERFLQTRYWMMVRNVVLELSRKKCRECSNWASQVHHPHYRFHGEEHLHIFELVPLCGVCHAANHGIHVHAGRRLTHVRHIVPAALEEMLAEVA